MRHPDERQIALYAGGETSWLERFSISRHLAACSNCRATADAYRKDRAQVRAEAHALPPGVNWERLSAEMTANIRVGLEAGECVNSVRARHRRLVGWRPALAAAGLAIILFSGWYLNFPSEQRASVARAMEKLWTPRTPAAELGVSLRATRNGIQVTENGSAMTMMHPDATPAMVVVSTRGALRARYVDDDTGQVMITNVYAQ